MRQQAFLAAGMALFSSFSIAAAADLPAPPVEAPPLPTMLTPFHYILSNDFRYYSFSGNRAYRDNIQSTKGSGSQFFAPASLEAVGGIAPDVTLDSIVRSGYVNSRQTSPNYGGAVSTTTDTSVTNTLTYLGFGQIQPFLALALNIPTGTSGLFGRATRARLDSDLVELGTFGEGFNVGPSLGVNIALTSEVVASLTIGYTHRGDFRSDLESFVTSSGAPSPGSRFSPGDLFSFSPTLAYQSRPLTLVATASLATEGDTLKDGVPDYRTGFQALAALSGSYRWSEQWFTSFSSSYQHVEPNKSTGGNSESLSLGMTTPFELDARNFNSDRFRVDLEHDYNFDRFSIGPTFGFLYRDRNAYDPIDLLFVPAKTQYRVGARAVYNLADNFTVTLRGEHGWTHQDFKAEAIVTDTTGNQVPTGQNGSYGPVNDQSWQVALGTVYKF